MVSLKRLRRRNRHHPGDYADKLEVNYEKAQIAHPGLIALITLVLAAGILFLLVWLW